MREEIQEFEFSHQEDYQIIFFSKVFSNQLIDGLF